MEQKELVGKKSHDRYVLMFDRPGVRDEIKVKAVIGRRTMNMEVLRLIDAGWEAIYGGKPGDQTKSAGNE